MTGSIEYKLAAEEDLPALERVGDKVFDYPVKPDRAKEFFEDPRHHLIIALHNGEVVGIATAFDYVHPDKEPTLFINEISVIEEFRNQHIARTMVRHLLDHGKSIGCQEAWLATEDSNQPARKAYLAVGGIEDEEIIRLYEFKMK